MYVKHSQIVAFDSKKLKAFVELSPFNNKQLSIYLGHGDAFMAQRYAAGDMGKEDWDKLANLLQIKAEDFAPEEGTKKVETAPMPDNSEMIKLLASINAHLANCEQYLNNINARTKAIQDDAVTHNDELHKSLVELKSIWK